MRRRFIALLLAFGAAAAALRAQDPAAQPLTAADILLLSSGAGDAASTALRSALASADPAARIAAGRVAAVLARGELGGALIGALAREHDAAVGAELVRDLLHLFGAQDLAVVEPQSKRLGGPAQAALVEWMARLQPDRFVERLGDFAADTDVSARLARLVSIAAWQHPDKADAVRRAWLAVGGKGTWGGVLRDAFVADGIGAPDAALLADALQSPRADVREDTVWFLLQAAVAGIKIPDPAIAAARTPNPEASPWEAFGRQLIARGKKPASGADGHTLLESEGPRHKRDLLGMIGAPQLTAAERDAIKIITASPAPFGDTGRPRSIARTVPALVPGVISATLRAAHCQPPASGIASAAITYGADGAPRDVSVTPGLPPACQAAWSALARTAFADATEPVSAEAQTVILLLDSDFIACAEEEPDAEPGQRRLEAVPAAVVSPPHKVKDVKPDYPVEAQGRGIQGVVVIDAVISRTGCVSRQRLKRSLPYLGLPAMKAVSGWRFEPAILNGAPVPVFMPVTVRFALQ